MRITDAKVRLQQLRESACMGHIGLEPARYMQGLQGWREARYESSCWP